MTAQTRRDWLTRTPAVLATGAIALSVPTEASAAVKAPSPKFGYCLNTSTIMGQKLPVVEQLKVAAKAGFGAVEPWLRDLDEYAKGGGSLAELKTRIADLGLKIPSAIGFAEWAVDDDARRAKGVEQMKRDMETVAAIGGTRIAAPPVGATDRADMDLRKVADRYRAILEIGDKIGVVPQVELWGFSKCLSRLGEVAMVAIDSRHPKACILADVYHLYRGGSDFSGLALLRGQALGVFHLNDYPASPPREHITDAQRVYPGDGVAPLGNLFRTLVDIGYDGFLSLELFNRDYWKEDPFKVARTGLEKLKAAVSIGLTPKA